MPGIREVRVLNWSAEQMFDLVADVGRYGEFLPWVIATRVKADSEREMIADMLVGFSAIREKFTSRVVKDRPREIRVHYIDGPLRDLDNRWQFRPL
ncbi:MAG TPA: type II toxin-antitoxin system RatA family toxin, partial [Novosphingobium sp.]|nr:type II toxin-antitoxin system RatA family toxin [Novosphingobium sp.]